MFFISLLILYYFYCSRFYSTVSFRSYAVFFFQTFRYIRIKYTHGKKLSITHSLTKHFYFDLINNPAKKQNRNIIESVYKWVY